MFDLGDDFVLENFKIPWLIWIQILVMFLLTFTILLSYFDIFVLDSSSTSNSSDLKISSSCSSSTQIVFAATIGVELATGNSVFKKMDVEGITEGLGACMAAVGCAAAFAYSYNARKRVGRIFSISCNAFIDALIDNIVDGLFYENDEVEQSKDNNV